MTKLPTICLVSFATDGFKFRQKMLNLTALKYGEITEVNAWDFEKLEQTEFFGKHQKILKQKRGMGYWLWKPYIILQQLKQVDEGDFVVYSDCGRGKPRLFRRSIQPLLAWCSTRGGVLPGIYIPQYGASKRWTKRDCYILTGCDEEFYWNHCQIQGSFSIWQKNQLSLSFLEQWLQYCTDERIVTDEANTCGLPNFPEFVGHRHDQSVLTLCALKQGLRALGDPHSKKSFCEDYEHDKDLDRVMETMGVAANSSLAKMAFLSTVLLLIEVQTWIASTIFHSLKRDREVKDWYVDS